MASVALDLELPDEGVELASLSFAADGVQSADAVMAASQSAAQAQRALRVGLLARHGLSMTNHVLHEAGPLPPTLLAALRVAMLTGDELRSLAGAADPHAGPLSEASERKACESLRAVLNGLAGAVDDDGTMHVLRHAYEALDAIEDRRPRRAAKRRRAGDGHGEHS